MCKSYKIKIDYYLSFLFYYTQHTQHTASTAHTAHSTQHTAHSTQHTAHTSTFTPHYDIHKGTVCQLVYVSFGGKISKSTSRRPTEIRPVYQRIRQEKVPATTWIYTV